VRFKYIFIFLHFIDKVEFAVPVGPYNTAGVKHLIAGFKQDLLDYFVCFFII